MNICGDFRIVEESKIRTLARRKHAPAKNVPRVTSVPPAAWLRPKLVAVIEFLEWREGDRLRHSKLVALREDKSPRDVVKEFSGCEPTATSFLLALFPRIHLQSNVSLWELFFGRQIMADIERISAQQAHTKAKSNQALLVCAYEDEAKCRMLNLDGSISFASFKSRVNSLPKSQEIIFY